MTEHFDFLVIGAGPAGISAGGWISHNFPGKSLVVIEKGQVAETLEKAPNVRWHSEMGDLMIPSVLNRLISPTYRPLTKQLAAYYRYVASEYRLDIREKVKVSGISQRDENLLVNLEERGGTSNLSVSASIVICCTGIMDLPKPLGLTGAQHVRRVFKTGIKSKNILVFGSGASAIDAVLDLLPSNRVTWVRRGSGVGADPANRVPAAIQTELAKVIRENQHHLALYDNSNVENVTSNLSVTLSSTITLGPFDEVFGLIGYDSDKRKLLVDGDVNPLNGTLSSNHHETLRPGVFTFGSINHKEKPNGKLEGASIRRHILDQIENLGSSVIEYQVKRVFSDPRAIVPQMTSRYPGLMGRVLRRLAKMKEFQHLFQLALNRIRHLAPRL